MLKLKSDNAKIDDSLVLPIMREKYADLGVKECTAYIYRVTGILLTKNQITRRAKNMGIVVSKETRARIAAKINRDRMTKKQLENEAIIKKFYNKKGSKYVSELTGLPTKNIVAKANQMGLVLCDELKAKVSKDNLVIRQKTLDKQKKGIRYPKDLTELECLALYVPWSKYTREPKETYIRNWPN